MKIKLGLDTISGPGCNEVPLQVCVSSLRLIVPVKLLSVVLLLTTLLLEDQHRFTEGLNCRSLHLDFLRDNQRIQ